MTVMVDAMARFVTILIRTSRLYWQYPATNFLAYVTDKNYNLAKQRSMPLLEPRLSRPGAVANRSSVRSVAPAAFLGFAVSEPCSVRGSQASYECHPCGYRPRTGPFKNDGI